LAYLCKNRLLKDKTLLGEEAGSDYHERLFVSYYELLEQGKLKKHTYFQHGCFWVYTREAQAITLAAIKEEEVVLVKTYCLAKQLPKDLLSVHKCCPSCSFLRNQVLLLDYQRIRRNCSANCHENILVSIKTDRCEKYLKRHCLYIGTAASAAIYAGKVDCMHNI